MDPSDPAEAQVFCHRAPAQPFAERLLQTPAAISYPVSLRTGGSEGSDTKCKLLCTQALVVTEQSKSACKAHDGGCSPGFRVGRALSWGAGYKPLTEKGASLAALCSPACREAQSEQVGRMGTKEHQAPRAAPVLNHAASPWSLPRQENEGRETKSLTLRLRHISCRTGGAQKSPRADGEVESRLQGRRVWPSPPRRWLCRSSRQG